MYKFDLQICINFTRKRIHQVEGNIYPPDYNLMAPKKFYLFFEANRMKHEMSSIKIIKVFVIVGLLYSIIDKKYFVKNDTQHLSV